MSAPRRPLQLVKLGGSLITDKRRPEVARDAVLERLGREVAAAAAALPEGLIVGHGAGSFGHVAAARGGVAAGITGAAGRVAASRTQDAAGRLHRRVVSALLAGGASPFSLAPGSFLVADTGRPVRVGLDPLLEALELGFLPVVFGDVVLDRRRGAAICSTETVFRTLVTRLARHGWRTVRVVWLGETEGIRDLAGRTFPRIDAGNAARAFRAVGGAAGTDATGGMRHRLEAARALARLGVESWIVDGRQPGLLGRALAGQEVPGTRVLADPVRRS